MYCLVLESKIFNCAMSRSSLRVLERIKLLHFRICRHSVQAWFERWLGDNLRSGIWLPEDSLNRLHS